jgi:ABC-type methionine transport system ATPase subunit
MVKEVLQVIQGLARDGMTLLIVTHEMAFARAVADRIVFMEAGRILEQNPRELLHPTADRTRAAVPGEILFRRKPAKDTAQGTVMKTAPFAKLLLHCLAWPCWPAATRPKSRPSRLPPRPPPATWKPSRPATS